MPINQNKATAVQHANRPSSPSSSVQTSVVANAPFKSTPNATAWHKLDQEPTSHNSASPGQKQVSQRPFDIPIRPFDAFLPSRPHAGLRNCNSQTGVDQ